MAMMSYLGIWRSQIQGGVRQVENDATFQLDRLEIRR